MGIKKDSLYSHENMLDVIIYVLSTKTVGEGDVECYVSYINKHLTGLNHGYDTIIIKKKDFSKWSLISAGGGIL